MVTEARCEVMDKNSTLFSVARGLVLFLSLMANGSIMAADGDSITTVADRGTSGLYYAKLCPGYDVAIDKDDAEVFSIYTDMGKGFFNVLRIRGGKNVIKVGDHVIVKTTEPKTIPLVTSDKQSSVSYDDIICPTEDTPVADFQASHPVNEGEYIYMLTNMERNGGFGFTHFTGTTMKKGNFYIVSTVEPETTSIHSMKGNTTTSAMFYNLQGQRVGTLTAGQIYIRDGRKFVYRGDENQTAAATAPAMTRAANDIEDGDQIPFLPGEAGNEDGF